jgi:hypothetical protein
MRKKKEEKTHARTCEREKRERYEIRDGERCLVE